MNINLECVLTVLSDILEETGISLYTKPLRGQYEELYEALRIKKNLK